MTNHVRLLIRMAEECGLRYCGFLDGKAHFQLVFENTTGQRMLKLAPHGTGGMGQSKQIKNSRAQFRRFARGETHGLFVLPAQVTTSETCS